MNKKCLSSSALKMIAIAAMLIDHLGFTVIYYLDHTQTRIWYELFRGVGRISFPIFCFLLVEGFLHTGNRRRYAGGLFLFALLSELPFDLAFHIYRSAHTSQNVYFTLLIGLLVMMGLDYFQGKRVMQAVCLLGGMAGAYLLQTDYDWKGVLLIAVLYIFRYSIPLRTTVGAVCLCWEWPAIFAFFPINLYNGERGWIRGRLKYIWYFFYPVHLLILAGIRFVFFVQALPVF